MYTWEIKNVLDANHYNVPSSIYLDICKSSPQICFVQYNDWNDNFVIRTYDGYLWNFRVHRDTP